MNREILDINDYTILLEEVSCDNNIIDSCFFDEPVIAIAFYGSGDVGLNIKFDGKTRLLVDNPLDRYLLNSSMIDSYVKNDNGP